MNNVIVYYIANGERHEFTCEAVDTPDAENQCRASAGDDILIILVRKAEFV
jgi:hypothetical protein